ncbi:MAG: FGGY-family carbohydrate kinase [Spirochaetales bacterium]|nr:FGGY-family carbohydrate kinase [Spirochaetales bacterium]
MILAADLGTSSLKAGLLSSDGHLVARVRVPYAHGSGGEQKEFDARDWEQAFLAALSALPSYPVKAVAISGNGPSMTACREDGEPLAPVSLWLQKSASSSPEITSYYLPKVVSIAEHHPHAFDQARWFLSCPEWLQYRLTGEAVMVTPHKSFLPYVWDDDQLLKSQLPPHKFPRIVTMGESCGLVTEKASARTGLKAGIPVVAVGSDFMAALLGSGAYAPGAVCDRAGTSEGINYCAHAPTNNPRFRELPHLVEGLWNVSVVLSSTGRVFEWYRRLTGQERRPYEATLAEVDAVGVNAHTPLFFPGRRGDVLWEFGGGGFAYLEPSHGRAEMGRAVMEAIAFAVRRGIEELETSHLLVDEMWVTGGQARGDVWNQMKADITGKTLIIPEIEDAELAGAAACALFMEHGLHDLSHAAKGFVRPRQKVEPRPSVSQTYDEVYRRYREAASIWSSSHSIAKV